jgi:hypothetical protein
MTSRATEHLVTAGPEADEPQAGKKEQVDPEHLATAHPDPWQL